MGEKEKEKENPEVINEQLTIPGVKPLAERIKKDQEAVRTLLDEQGRIKAIEDEANQAREMRSQMCGHFLESALQASKLPLPAQERIRKQFAGRVFDAPELQTAIEDTRALVSELTSGAVVQGSRIHSIFDTRDQLQAAADDLLGAPRDKETAGLKVAKLSGIRELYLMLTGDYDLHGGYNSERIQLATTLDFTGLVKNALNKIVISTWDQLGKAGYDWWSKVVRVEHFIRSRLSPVPWWVQSELCPRSQKGQNIPNWPSATAPKPLHSPNTGVTSPDFGAH